MTMFSGEWFAAVGTAVGVGVVLLVSLVVRHRRRSKAGTAQLRAQEAYDAAVRTFREATAQSRARREELLRLLELAQGEPRDLAPASGEAPYAEDPMLSRFYLDLADARDDEARREALVLNLQRAIMGLEILNPEAPVPPAPLVGLRRRARKQAAAWYAERSAVLPELENLAVPAPALVSVPRQQQRGQADDQPNEGTVLAGQG